MQRCGGGSEFVVTNIGPFHFLLAKIKEKVELSYSLTMRIRKTIARVGSGRPGALMLKVSLRCILTIITLILRNKFLFASKP